MRRAIPRVSQSAHIERPSRAWRKSLSRKKPLKRRRETPLGTLKAKAWKLFSEYVRRKYADENGMSRCYTSGAVAHWRELQCGHAIGGRHNAVLFDEEICRPQSVGDNVFKRGNYQVFITKLIKENGLEWWEKKLEDSRRVLKYTRADLQRLIDETQQKLSSL